MHGSADILNALQGTQGASRALYKAVFGRDALRQYLDQAQSGRGRGWANPSRKQAWEAPRRIPAAQQPLVRALGQLLGADLCLLNSWANASDPMLTSCDSPHPRPSAEEPLRMAPALVLLFRGPYVEVLRQAISVCADRAKKCPFGLLLEHHCPLPDGLIRSLPRGPQHLQQRFVRWHHSNVKHPPYVGMDLSRAQAASWQQETSLADALPAPLMLLHKIQGQERSGARV